MKPGDIVKIPTGVKVCLNDDEYLEVTPKNTRIRKIQLDHNLRMRDRAKMLGLR